jgi:catechol 2,3-dioxygenase-like lactoylglutathione lyase family enzyme
MITNVSIVSVFVKDVDASKAFYLDVLGFEEHTDLTLGDGYRWCTVRSREQPELQVHLTVAGPPMTDYLVEAVNRALDEGSMNGVGVTVEDCQKSFEELSGKGVEFLQEPQERPYGVEAVCRDNSGNWMVLVEPREFTAEDFPHG